MAANTKYAVYKIFNGTDFDTIYFKAPAAAITETATKDGIPGRQFITPEDNTNVKTYLKEFNAASKLVKLGTDGKIPSDLINADFSDYLDKRLTAGRQNVNSEVSFNYSDGVFIPNGIYLNSPTANYANSNRISSITDVGVRISLGKETDRQEITFTKAGTLDFKEATEITNVKLGADTSAVPKSYVDTVIESGAKPIEMVKAATLAPQSATPSTLTPKIDGVTVSVGDRVLLLGQSNASNNGVYIVSTGDWTKESNSKGALVFVQEGTANNDSKWFHEGDGEWFKFSQTDQLQFLGGLTRSGDNVTLANDHITNAHIKTDAAIALSKLGDHTGDITYWDSYSTPSTITTPTALSKRINDLAMTIFRIRGDVSVLGAYGAWTSNSLSIKDAHDLADAKQNPVRSGTAMPTALSSYKDGDIYLLLDN